MIDTISMYSPEILHPSLGTQVVCSKVEDKDKEREKGEDYQRGSPSQRATAPGSFSASTATVRKLPAVASHSLGRSMFQNHLGSEPGSDSCRDGIDSGPQFSSRTAVP